MPDRSRPANASRLDIRPIGVVHKEGDLARIRIDPQHADALLGIDALKAVQVLYWMHRLPEADRRRLQVHPRGDTSRPVRGVFALRSPMRPNPIGSTHAELVRREGNDLIVKGLDALDGSPVIDIKFADPKYG